MKGDIMISTEHPLPQESNSLPHEVQSIVSALEDSKAQNINILDLEGKADFVDQMIFVSGTSTTHLHAIADHIVKALKAINIKAVSVNKERQADWILVDTGSVIIHIFHPEKRAFYQLEKMWAA